MTGAPISALADALHDRYLIAWAKDLPRCHFVPRTELVKETLEWLDRYLGPVE